MLNRKHFPFERNSYYYGKLLTSRDLEAEQRYNNDKRRLGNRLAGGHGIVAGLGVVMADDSSVVLQAGAALDAGGREIVVPETKVVKVSTIEGYDTLETSCAYLGLAYRETPVDQVFAALSQQQEGGEATFNRIQEGYRLSLVDERAVTRLQSPLDEFVWEQVLYSDEEVVLTQYTPRFVARGSDLCIHVRIRKTGHGLGEYAFRYSLEVPDFTGEGGEGELTIAANGLKLAHGDMEEFRYTLIPQPHVWSGGEIHITAKDLLIQSGDASYPINSRWDSVLKPVDMDLTDCCRKAWYEKAMDQALGESCDDKLWIAKIDLLRQNNAVIVTGVEPPPFDQYSYNAQQLMALRLLERYYPSSGAGSRDQGGGEIALSAPSRSGGDAFDFSHVAASGVFDLGLGLGYNTKEAIYSEEIMHGLGKGPVYVEVGVEYIAAREEGAEDSEIYLGDLSVFSQEEKQDGDERIYKVSTGVKVLAERGTFVVGVLPRETSGLISLRIRWFAMRMGEVSKQIRPAREGQQYIVINPDTIVVAPKGTAHIKPIFVGMPSEACSFRMVDEEGGTIDNNGVYTAPAKEGVYEIRVEAVSDPSVYACAFAMVSQKKKEE